MKNKLFKLSMAIATIITISTAVSLAEHLHKPSDEPVLHATWTPMEWVEPFAVYAQTVATVAIEDAAELNCIVVKNTEDKQPITDKATIVSDATVHAAKDHGSEILATVLADNIVSIGEVEKEWVEVHFLGQTGYMKREHTDAVWEDPHEPELFATCTVTAYCNCSRCCGKWSGGRTAAGTWPAQGRTVAVDPDYIPLGTHIIIDGHEYIAEDTGSGVDGYWIDMYFDSHSEALNWGMKKKDVYIVR